MMRAPTRTAIYAAEMRVVEARWNMREHWSLARTALHAKIPRPATVAVIAGVAGLLALLVTRRRKPVVAASPVVGRAAKARSVLRRAMTFLVQYQLRGLPFVLQEAAAGWSQRAAQPDVVSAPAPATDYSAATVLH